MKVLKKINRLEVIDHSEPFMNERGETLPGKGRTVIFWDDNKEVAVDVQDEGRTLKLFISDKGTTGVQNTSSDIPDFEQHKPSMAFDDILDDIEIPPKPDARNFRVDRNKPAIELEGVTGQEELSPNEE